MKPKTVDEYISNVPKEIQEKLKAIHTTIREAVPDAQEKLSYGRPYYGYKGRLAYFVYMKKHVGLYILSPIIQSYKFCTCHSERSEESPPAGRADLANASLKQVQRSFVISLLRMTVSGELVIMSL